MLLPEAALEIVDESTESNSISCVDIPDNVQDVKDEAFGEKKAYCVIDKTVDPNTTINQAKVDECVGIANFSVDTIQRIDCADPTALRITTIVDEPLPATINGEKTPEFSEDVAIKFCQDNGTPEPAGYFSLDFSYENKKDARTWCFSV